MMKWKTHKTSTKGSRKKNSKNDDQIGEYNSDKLRFKVEIKNK
jgi:hypothetical protein